MATVKQRSFGIVPVAVGSDGSWLFLVLRAFRNWDFPKGGPDDGETRLETALREMREETGIEEIALPWGEASIDTEIYARGKVATYFLGQVTKQEIVLPVSAELGRPEHDEYRWVSSVEAGYILPSRLVPILGWASGIIGGKK